MMAHLISVSALATLLLLIELVSGQGDDAAVLSCGPVPNVPHATAINTTDTSVGAKVRYACHHRYNHTGSRNANKCRKRGTWTSNVQCLYNSTVGCADRSALPAFTILTGLPSVLQWTFPEGTSAHVVCGQGYAQSIPRQSTVVCTAIGAKFEWRGSGMGFQCHAKRCLHPGTPENGGKYSSVYTTKSRVQFYCNMGYELQGARWITCLVDGEWTGSTPYCERACYPPQLNRTQLAPPRRYYRNQQQVGVTCTAGSRPVPGAPPSATCVNGRWHPADPTDCKADCVEYQLEHGANSDVAQAELGDVPHGTERSVLCAPGYTLSAVGNSVRCDDGGWRGDTDATCRLGSCVEYRQEYGVNHNRTGPELGLVPHDTRVNLFCSSGYVLNVSNSAVRCHNGSWEGDTNVQCISVVVPTVPAPTTVTRLLLTTHSAKINEYEIDTICGPLPVVANGHPTGRVPFDTGPKVRYTCDIFYIHTGPRKANKCQKNKRWTDNVRCSYNSTVGCDLTDLPEHTGLVGLPDVEWGMHAEYTEAQVECLQGYTRDTASPRSRVWCAWTGSHYKWQGDGTSTRCTLEGEMSCDPTSSLSEISVKGITFMNMSLLQHGSKRNFSCNVKHFIAKGIDKGSANYNRVKCMNGQFTPMPWCEGETSCNRSASYEGLKFDLLGLTPNGAKDMFQCIHSDHVAAGLNHGSNQFNYVLCNSGRFCPPPRCEPVSESCHLLHLPKGIRFMRTGMTVNGQKEKFTCEERHFLARGIEETNTASNYVKCVRGSFQPVPSCEEPRGRTPFAPSVTAPSSVTDLIMNTQDEKIGKSDSGEQSSCNRSEQLDGLKFELPGLTRHGTIDMFECTKIHFLAVGLNNDLNHFNYVKCVNGQFKPFPDCNPPPCLELPETSLLKFLTSGHTEHGMTANYECLKDAVSLPAKTRLGETTCSEGEWIPTPACQRSGCYRSMLRAAYRTCNGDIISQWTPMTVAACVLMCHTNTECEGVEYSTGECRMYKVCRMSFHSWRVVYKKHPYCQ